MRGPRAAALVGCFLLAAWGLATYPGPVERVLALPRVDLVLRFPSEAGSPVRWAPRAPGNPPFGEAPAESVVVYADLAADHRPIGPAGPPRAALEWRRLAPGEGRGAADRPFGKAFLALHEVQERPCPPAELAAITGFAPAELARILGATRWRAHARDRSQPVDAYEVVAWRTATHRFTFARRGDAASQLVVRLQMPSVRPLGPEARFDLGTPAPGAP